MISDDSIRSKLAYKWLGPTLIDHQLSFYICVLYIASFTLKALNTKWLVKKQQMDFPRKKEEFFITIIMRHIKKITSVQLNEVFVDKILKRQQKKTTSVKYF